MQPQTPNIATPSQNSIYPATQSELQQQQKGTKSSRSLSSMKYSDEEQIYEDDRNSSFKQQRKKKKNYIQQQNKQKKYFKMSQRPNDGISKIVLIAFLGCVGVIVVVGLVMIGVYGGKNVATRNVNKTVDNDFSVNHSNDDDNDQDTSSKSLTKQKNSIIPKRVTDYTKSTLQTTKDQQGIQQSVVRYCGKDIDKTPKKLSQANNTNLRQHYVQTNHGFNLYVDSKDEYVSRFVSTDGTWQPNYINIIGHIVKPGNKILNVGSQFGIEAVLMGKIIGSSGHMFIFEPYSFSNKLLTKNIQTNGLSHITTIYSIGASSGKSSAIIQVAYANTGGSEIVSSSIQRSRVNSHGQVVNEEEEVQMNSIDATLPPDTVLDFALLDVQLMEVEALKGMREVILRSPNLIIMCQWQYLNNKNRNEAEARSILQFMISRGYGIYSYRGGNPITCEKGIFTEYSRPNQLLKIKNNDIFFIPKSHPRLSQLLMAGSERNIDQKEKEQSRQQQVNKPVKKRQNKIYCGSVVNQRPIKLNQIGQDPNERSKLVSTNYGFNLYVDSKDQDVASSIQNNGIWSSNKINQIGNILKPANKILNLGSQVGIEAVLMGKLIGSQGQMFIFEPYSFSNKLVTKNIQINNLSNITTIYRIAASDTQSSGMIQVTYPSQGPNTGKQNSNGQTINEEEEIQMNTVDATLPPGTVLDFALIDVQKMEVEALKGMRQVILRSPNLIIMCEWQYLSNQNRNEADARQILQFMISRGYGFFSYKNDNPSQCFVGSFLEYRLVEQLLQIKSDQLIMIPKRHPNLFSIISG